MARQMARGGAGYRRSRTGGREKYRKVLWGDRLREGGPRLTDGRQQGKGSVVTQGRMYGRPGRQRAVPFLANGRAFWHTFCLRIPVRGASVPQGV